MTIGQEELVLASLYLPSFLFNIYCPCDVMVKVLDSGFELQSRYYIHFQNNSEGIEPPLTPPTQAMILVSLLFFYKEVFGIKLPTKIGMLLNKETKPILTGSYLSKTKTL